MWAEKGEEWEKKLGVELGHPLFYSRLHTLVSYREQQGKSKEMAQICSGGGESFSKRLSRSAIQEGCSARNVALARELSYLLIGEEGKLSLDALDHVIAVLEGALYGLGPRRRHDGVRRVHVLEVLKQLRDQPSFRRAIEGFQRPFSHLAGERLIRASLGLPEGVALTDGDAKRAALSALLTYLRQNVGSCFATAPAILVHEEHPLQFLRDLSDLLATGSLRRVVRGEVYSVPLSPSWGAGDLRRPLPLAHPLEKSPQRIWFSPGLGAALESVGLIEPREELSVYHREMLAILSPAAAKIGGGKPLFYGTVEELLRSLIQQKHGLDEKWIESFANRPTPLAQQDLSGASGGESEQRMELYQKELQVAFDAFKSVTDHALLKAWEFTVASFAETKFRLTKWNLYSSLGFGFEEPGGIGEKIHDRIALKLEEAKEEVEKQQELYDQVYYQVKHLEGRLQRAADEKQARWLKAEYMTQRNEAHTHAQLRDQAHRKAQQLAHLPNQLVDGYLTLFPSYFQEVYDANIRETVSSIYDDSPAGFRLIYKHGRSDTSQWTMIHGPDEFCQHLASFFIAVEGELRQDAFLAPFEDEIAFITTALVTHVKTDEFLESALARMAAAHKVPLVERPLENLDQVAKKPWVYTSGGTMKTLVQCYFGREEPPRSSESWMESPEELFAFLIELIRKIPTEEVERFWERRGSKLLMHSPTHAFLLLPGSEEMEALFKSPTYSYTWIKERVILPTLRQLNQMRVDREGVEEILRALLPKVSQGDVNGRLKRLGGLPASLSVPELRKWVSEELSRQGISGVKPELDALLYQQLPFTRRHQLSSHLLTVFKDLSPYLSCSLSDLETYLERHLRGAPPLISAKAFRQIALSLILCIEEKTYTSHNFPLLVAQAMRRQGLAFPAPFIFADSNWVTDYFAFLVNPGTEKLELWRVDGMGLSGAPMSHWEKWLNGSQRSPTWGVYTHRREYHP